MASTSETGHAKNVANFADLISFCTGYGENYNPVNDSLKILQLQSLYDAAQNAITNLKPLKTDYDRAVNDRILQFDTLKPLSTRITNAFAICGADPEAVKDVKSINKKIQGIRSSKLPKADPAHSEAPLPETHSVSQLSYDSLIENFTKLVVTVSKEPAYKPNETGLSVASLQTKTEDLKNANKKAVTIYTPYSNSLISRNKIMYSNNSSLFHTAAAVKKYGKSVFGASSPEYRQISGLKFSRPRNL